MEKITALLIKKGAYVFIEINQNYNYDDVRKLLGTNEKISHTYRLLEIEPLPLKFKVISKDYVSNPKFFTGVYVKNGKIMGDIPEECLIILSDMTFDNSSIEEYPDISMNSLIQSLLESSIGYYSMNKDGKNIQPAIVWTKGNSIF